VTVVARVILVLTLPAAIAGAAFRPPAATPRVAHTAIVTSPAKTPNEAPAGDDFATQDDATGAVDLYGNQVTDAVAKYKLDATGTLYELHSPQTELPRLPSPKS